MYSEARLARGLATLDWKYIHLNDVDTYADSIGEFGDEIFQVAKHVSVADVYQLYDLKSDPKEQVNLVTNTLYKDVLASLQKT